MDPVDETSTLRLEIGDLVLEVEVLLSDIASSLGETTEIEGEFLVAVAKTLVVSTDSRSDEFSEQSEVVLVNCAHGGEFENDRLKEGGRKISGRLKLGFKVRIK